MLELVFANLKSPSVSHAHQRHRCRARRDSGYFIYGFSTRNVGRYVETLGKLEGGNRFHTTGRDGNDEFKRFGFDQICRPSA